MSRTLLLARTAAGAGALFAALTAKCLTEIDKALSQYTVEVPATDPELWVGE